jgi:tetratricopeptide (TPR) repeat protein
MKRKRKIILLLSGGVVLLLLAALLVRFILISPYRSQIPALPELQSLSAQLKDQLSLAYKKAYRNPTSDNLGSLGMAYHSCANYDKAVICYKLAIKRDNTKWIWSYYLACLTREMGEPEAALENFRSVLSKNPKVYQAWYYSGECYQKLGSLDKAEQAFNNITRLMDKNDIVKTNKRYDYFPLVTYTMYHLAQIYMDTKRIDLAESILKEIIDYQRAFGPAYRLLGNIYILNGEISLGKKFIVRANDLIVNPSPVDTLVDRLSLMSRSDMYLLKKIDEAETSVYSEYALELVNHGLIYIPENNYLIAKAIKFFLVSDRGKQALPYLNQHMNYFQQDFNELKNVGDLLYNKGFYAQAMNYYSEAEKLKPEDPRLQSCIAICLSKEGQKKQAKDLIAELLEKNKKNPEVLADGISLLFNLGEKETALSWLGRLKLLSPSNPKGLQLSAMLAEQAGKMKEAISLYESAFKGDPEDMTTIRLLGNLLIQQKMWDKAISLFRKALEFHPNESFLLERLGTLLVSCPDPKFRKIEEGRDFCERAFIHTSSHSLTLISAGRSLAIAYATLGDKRNASNIIRMTIKLVRNGNFPSSYLSDLEKLLQQFSRPN